MKATVIYRPTHSAIVLTLQQFLEALSGPVNRAAVREAVMDVPQFPLVSLSDINKILRGWQFETAVFKAQPDLLNRLSGPLLAYCNWHDGDKYFVVIRRTENGMVHYFSPYAGETAEPLGSFAAHWQGLLLGASPVEQEGGHLWGETDEETEAVGRYRREAIKVYDQFFPVWLCQYIIRYAEEQSRFERSKVEPRAGGGHFSPNRTSSSITLKNRAEPVLQSVYQRVSDLLGVPGQHIETLQCVRYSEGQQFKPHFDVNDNSRPFHTLLLYLNDDFEGGETFFPELNLKITPAQGRVLHFLNCDESDRVVLQAIHAGLPVRRGVKCACNIWVRDNLVI